MTTTLCSARAARVGVAIAIALAVWATPIASDASEKPVTFPELVDGHIKARIGRSLLPASETGQRFDAEPAVYVTITPTELLVFGHVVHRLSEGRVKRTAVARCASGVDCIPALTSRIATMRAALGNTLRIVPRVLFLVDQRVPYSTLLLVLRSAAEAHTHLSMRIVGRSSGDELLELPVFVAPGRQHTIRSAAPPALITVHMTGDDGVVSADRSYQPNGAVRARGRDSILHEIGLLQLSSGRTAFFLAATSQTSAGSVLDVVARSREQFRHVIFMAPGDQPVIAGTP